MQTDTIVSRLVQVGMQTLAPDGSGVVPLNRDLNNQIPAPSQGDMPQLIYRIREDRQVPLTFGLNPSVRQDLTIEVDYLHSGYNLDYQPNVTPQLNRFAASFLKAIRNSTVWTQNTALIAATAGRVPDQITYNKDPFWGVRFTVTILNFPD